MMFTLSVIAGTIGISVMLNIIWNKQKRFTDATVRIIHLLEELCCFYIVMVSVELELAKLNFGLNFVFIVGLFILVRYICCIAEDNYNNKKAKNEDEKKES